MPRTRAFMIRSTHRLVLDGLAQSRDQPLVFPRHTVTPVRIGKEYGLRPVFGEHGESLPRSAVGVLIGFYSDFAEDLNRGRVQPLARQPLGGVGVRLEQDDRVTVSGREPARTGCRTGPAPTMAMS